jgi:hypothetical protein
VNRPVVATQRNKLEARRRDFTFRRAGPGDAEVIAALFDSMDRDGSHASRSLALVTHFLRGWRNFQIVAEDASRVVASVAMAYQRWNDSYELGPALTAPEYRRTGLTRVLMQQVVDCVGDAALGELTFGYLRARRIADLGSALGPQMTVVGHDNGRNVADGTRQTQLISCGIPYHARFTHVRPAVDELSGCPFLRNIYSKLRLNGPAGAYPPEYFVGGGFNTFLFIGPWTFAYSAEAPEGSLEIADRDADGSSPEHIAEELGEVLSRLRGVQHFTTTVLADKCKMVRALVRQGFQVSAYLPAWYKVGRFRYDCVQLTRRRYTGEPAIQDLGDWLEELNREFQRLPYCGEEV